MPARLRAFSVHVTPREVEILDLLVQGLGNDEIGVSMGIGTGTVKHYISGLAAKLHVDNSDRINRRILLARYWSCELFRIGAGRGDHPE
jgi:DNA-binding NarL/FixJ family response regulator